VNLAPEELEALLLELLEVRLEEDLEGGDVEAHGLPFGELPAVALLLHLETVDSARGSHGAHHTPLFLYKDDGKHGRPDALQANAYISTSPIRARVEALARRALLVAALLLSVSLAGPACIAGGRAGGRALHVSTFSDGGTEASAHFAGPESNASVSVTLPVNASVLDARVDLSGMPDDWN
jgi:hypothetical protein